MERQIRSGDTYPAKLLKIIPAEIIAAYLAAVGLIPKTYEYTLEILIIISIFLFCCVPLYLVYVIKIQKPGQLIFSTLSFAVWVFSIGGPFTYISFYQPFIGSIVLILWTLIIPFVYKPADEG